jgi:ATP-dependent Lon protease
MSRTIALFPLQIVVFPGEALNLHIFEPRYRQLIRDCEQDQVTFAIPFFQDGSLKEYATEVRLLAIEKVYPGGEMDVKTQGLGIVRIQEFYPQLGEKLYAGGLVKDYPFESNENLLLNEQILQRARDLFVALDISKPLPKNAVAFTTFDIAHYVGFNPDQEYEFLLTLEAAARQHILLEQINRVIPVVKEMENLRNLSVRSGISLGG